MRLDQGHALAVAGGSQRGGGADHAGTDDDQVEGVTAAHARGLDSSGTWPR